MIFVLNPKGWRGVHQSFPGEGNRHAKALRKEGQWVSCRTPGPFDTQWGKRHLCRPVFFLSTLSECWATRALGDGYEYKYPRAWEEEGPWWKWYRAAWGTDKGIQRTSMGNGVAEGDWLLGRTDSLERSGKTSLRKWMKRDSDTQLRRERTF